MAKATSSQAWLWHRRLSHLNFDTINLLSKNDIVVGLPKLKFVKDHLCSSCELGKAKRKSFHSKLTPSSKSQLHLLHMDLCGPMRVASINGKRYVLVIVDDYSRYTWTHFLRDGENLDKMKEEGTTSTELDLLFSPMFDELLNGSSKVVSKSSAVSAVDAPNKQSDAEMCMFALTVSRTEPKNINEAMTDSAWIESMQEELHQFDRLDVWELVDR
nr:retrovirus-related Pol polyprotein from transposon TNT 1-94 [Tanacetum cinerariifolium]